ncbi:calcium-binding protein P-like [Argopecten irradians]|uniref:calcium-binding protein P-like n=1 Tax=Argopecten irradians TaxID=31199 RepID=UPI003713001C
MKFRDGNVLCAVIALCIAFVHSQGTTTTSTGQQNGVSFPTQTMFLGQETGANSGQTDSTPNIFASFTGQPVTVPETTNQSQFGFPAFPGQTAGTTNGQATNSIVPSTTTGTTINSGFTAQVPGLNGFPGQPPQALNTVFSTQTGIQTLPGQQNRPAGFPGQPGVQPMFPGQAAGQATPGQVPMFVGQPGMQAGFPGQPGMQPGFPGQQRPSVFPTTVFPGQAQPFTPQNTAAFPGQIGVPVTAGSTDQQGNQQTGNAITGTGQFNAATGGQQQPGIITGQGQTFITGNTGQQPGQLPGQPMITGGQFGPQTGPQPGQFGPQTGIQTGQFGQQTGIQTGQFGQQNGIQTGQFGQQTGMQTGQFGPQTGIQTGQFGPQTGIQTGQFGQNGQFRPPTGQFGPGGQFGPNPFNPFGQRPGQCHTTGCPGGSQCVFAPTGAHMCPTWIPILPCSCRQGCQAQNLFIPLGQSRQIDRCGNTCTCNSPDGTPACTNMNCPPLQQQQQQGQQQQTQPQQTGK